MSPEQPSTSAASEHCYTPSWCKCPDEPRCLLCKQGRCPVEPETSAATHDFTVGDLLRYVEKHKIDPDTPLRVRDQPITGIGRTAHGVMVMTDKVVPR